MHSPQSKKDLQWAQSGVIHIGGKSPNRGLALFWPQLCGGWPETQEMLAKPRAKKEGGLQFCNKHNSGCD